MGRLVFRLFKVMVLLTCTELRYLAFSTSTCFCKDSTLACLSDNGCLGLKLEGPSIPAELPSSFSFISESECSSFCSLFSSFPYFLCRLCSSSCCKSIEWMADQKLLIASEVTWDYRKAKVMIFGIKKPQQVNYFCMLQINFNMLIKL